MDHVGVIVDDLEAAIEFFVELGLELGCSGVVKGLPVDRIVGLDGVRSEFAFVHTPDGQGRLELIKLLSPSLEDGDPHAPANTPGLRHLAFAVDDIEAAVDRLQARRGRGMVRASAVLAHEPRHGAPIDLAEEVHDGGVRRLPPAAAAAVSLRRLRMGAAGFGCADARVTRMRRPARARRVPRSGSLASRS